MTVLLIAGFLALVALGIVAVLRYLQRRPDKMLGYLAQHDHLTGLINRALFRDRLSSALVRARRDGGLVTVMFLDIDGFKDINDRFGHAVGDEMLRQIERRGAC